MKFLFCLLIFSGLSYAQSDNIIMGQQGFILYSNGVATVDKTGWDSFDEASNPSSYKKSQNGRLINYVVFKNGNNISSVVKVQKNEETGNTISKTYSFKASKLDSFTECFGGKCRTVSKNLCQAVRNYYKSTPGRDTLDAANAKHKECQDFYTDIYRNVFEPHAEELATLENQNLERTSQALTRTGFSNIIKAFQVAITRDNRSENRMKSALREVMTGQYGFETEMMDNILNCHQFSLAEGPAATPSPASGAAATSSTASPH